jgi:Tfp pilus assembly protein PilX
MKTKMLIKLAALLIAVIGISTAGCKKDKNETDTNSLQQLTKDQRTFQSASDDVLSDANTVLSNGTSKSIESLPCNVTIDSSSIVGDTIIYAMTFNGLNCSGTHNRVGNATIKKNVNTHWSQAGATVTITFINLKITKVSSGKSIILNGTKKFENVSGGLLVNLGGSATSIVHKVTGSLQATFDDNTTRTWNVARQKTYTGTLGSLIITVDGLGTADGYNNLETWGTNRNGELFYSKVDQSVVFRQTCDWDPIGGIMTYMIPSDNKQATVTFGYDDNNQPVTSGTCPSRYKVDWEKGTHSGTLYIQYP